MNRIFRLCIFIGGALLLCPAIYSFGQHVVTNSFDGNLNECIRRVYPACIRAYGIDTVRNMQTSSQFSAVVVSAEGHILTVAHAVMPGRTYKVSFPDGRVAYAAGMGRIVTDAGRTLPDVAMMKLLGRGPWPFAEMGFSDSLHNEDPCFGISYPESLAQLKPMVRKGRILAVKDEWGFLESTCIMETGDSGGPLFDLNGRVIGLHSRIDQPEAANYEVPVDIYRKYWNALNVQKNYDQWPPTEGPKIDQDPPAGQTNHSIAVEKEDKQAVEKIQPENCVILLSSKINDTLQSIQATVVTMDDKAQNLKGNHIALVSKCSMVGQEPYMITTDGKKLKCDIIRRDEDKDIILLVANGLIAEGIGPTEFSSDTFSHKDLGRSLYSPLSGQRAKNSVIGSLFFDLPPSFRSGYSGMMLPRDGQLFLRRVAPGSPAEKAGLKANDKLVAMNGVPLNGPDDFGKEALKYLPGNSVRMDIKRGDSMLSIRVLLTNRPLVTANHPMDKFTGGKSIRRDGFRGIFVHDARIRSYECGGPVFDAANRFVGINIARFSHVSTVVIPAAQVWEFIRKTGPSVDQGRKSIGPS